MTAASSARTWLALREPADADARAAELLDPLRERLAGGRRLVIRDLGCGTGSMGRWLRRRLPGPQHWVLHDRDPALLDHAAAHGGSAADGAPVTVETRQGDVTALTAADLAGADLVTASALLDLLTAGGGGRGSPRRASARGCPALLTLSVAGRGRARPGRPARRRDRRRVQRPPAAQRRRPAAARPGRGRGGGRGVRAGTARRCRSGPARGGSGPDQAALTAEWLRGWVGAACEQRPDLPACGGPTWSRRLAGRGR